MVTAADGRGIVRHVLETVPDQDRVLVGVDGVGASGKTSFAIALAEQARPRPVVLIHVDDYFNPAPVRHARGRLSALGFWLDAYDYDALISRALAPLSWGGSGLYSPGLSARAATVQAPADALVIVEGVFLHRDELTRFWDHSIFLDVAVEEANRRMIGRGGLESELAPGLLSRYNEAQALYFAHARPWERASLVVDNTDPAAPAIIDPAHAHAAR